MPALESMWQIHRSVDKSWGLLGPLHWEVGARKLDPNTLHTYFPDTQFTLLLRMVLKPTTPRREANMYTIYSTAFGSTLRPLCAVSTAFGSTLRPLCAVRPMSHC